MLTKQATPFRNQLAATHKQLQVIKLREYIYNYLCKLDGISEDEACAIANIDASNRLIKTSFFKENDIRYVNGRLEEIEKLDHEIKDIQLLEN